MAPPEVIVTGPGAAPDPAGKLRAKAWFASLSPEDQAELVADFTAMHSDVSSMSGKYKAEKSRADRYHDLMTQDDPGYAALLDERTAELRAQQAAAEEALKAAQTELEAARGHGPELEQARQQLAEAQAKVTELGDLHERWRKWADEVVYPSIEENERVLQAAHGEMDALHEGVGDLLRYALHRADPEVATAPDAPDELLKDLLAAGSDFDPKDAAARFGKLDGIVAGFVARRKGGSKEAPKSSSTLHAQLGMQSPKPDRPQFTGGRSSDDARDPRLDEIQKLVDTHWRRGR